MTQIYQTPRAFETAVRTKLKARSAAANRPYAQFERQLILQRFLARVFHNPENCWVLKGGTGILVRIPEARYSKDIDLYNQDLTVDAAIEDLRRIAEIPGLDPFAFRVGIPTELTGQVAGIQIKVTAYLGVREFGTVPIDLSTNLLEFSPDVITPTPVIEVGDVKPLPAMKIYPLPQQIADKVCAMYSTYSGTNAPSTRYHDLIDLVILIRDCHLEAAPLRSALTTESARRKLALPTTLVPPGPNWTSGYNSTANESGRITIDLRRLDAALAYVGNCLNPILSNRNPIGHWNPNQQAWSSDRPI